MVDQQRDVLAALAQCRHLDLRAPNPEVEVLAELPLRDALLEVPVRRGDEPDIGLPPVVGTEPHDLARLQHTQELRLHDHRHVTDLVEEERPGCRVFEDALTVAVRTGEGASHVTEQLVLQQRLALAGGVEGHVP